MPKQTTDVTGATYGIIYDAPEQTWTVAKGVTVGGAYGSVSSGFSSSTLVNRGTLTSDGYGVYFSFDGGSATIVNAGAGVIEAYRGIAVLGVDLTIDFRNGGLIEGSEFAVSVSGAFGGTFRNKGTIKADLTAMALDAAGGSDGITIENSGRIVGGDVAIGVDSFSHSKVTIFNKDKGIIKGGDIAIGVAEKLVLKNLGKIGGTLATGSSNDKVINKNKIKGDVWLGDGADYFINKNKAKAGMIDAGDDLNVVVLGFRSDKLLFDSALIESNRTTVKNFESGEDRLFLDEDRFTALTPGQLSSAEFRKGTKAEDADDHIIYDQKSGFIYYDPDGAGGAPQVAFAVLQKGTKLAASDFKVGEYSILDI